ncbi:MAG: hypothetical protein ACLQOZ_01805 [Acidimicrobiales bacterium]
MPDPDPTQADHDLPRMHPSSLHLASGPFAVTITWLDADPTELPEGQLGPHGSPIRAIGQTVIPLGMAKAMIPLLVKMIAEYETKFGQIPSPGFDELSKD